MDDAPKMPAPAAKAALSEAVDEVMQASLSDLAELVSIPAIAWPGHDPGELERAAAAAARMARSAGLPDVRVLRSTKPDGTMGAPAVIARRTAPPGCPTVLLYAHYDVQPAGEAGLWQSPPFTLEERSGRLFGRGVADDKAGIIMHLAALRAYDSVSRPATPTSTPPGPGITLFLEGEEEAGSPSLSGFLREHGDLLTADVAVVADSGNWRVGVPALTTTLRGLVDATVEVRALPHGLHSGTFGGPVLDALTQLSHLLASFHHGDGSVAVAGLAPSPDPEVDYDERAFRNDAGLTGEVPLAGRGSLASRLWSQPALAVTGIDAPSVEAASNLLVPTARARISLRIPPGSRPEVAMEALRRHIEDHVPPGCEVIFTPGNMSRPFGAPKAVASGSAGAADRINSGLAGLRAEALMLEAMESAWGTSPVRMGVGGSIPVVAALLQRFPQVQILITGAEDPDSRAHGVDESLDLGDLHRGILAEALLLSALGSQCPAAPDTGE